MMAARLSLPFEGSWPGRRESALHRKTTHTYPVVAFEALCCLQAQTAEILHAHLVVQLPSLFF
jgi:hypothetical protein